MADRRKPLRRCGLRLLGASTALAIATALVAAAPAVAAPAPAPDPAALPTSWAVVGTATGPVLTWTTPQPLPVADARLEVRSGDRLLGIGQLSPDRRQVSIPIRPTDLSALRAGAVEPSVWAAGRRLDLAGAAQRSAAPDDQVLGATNEAADRLLTPDPGSPGPYRTVTGEYVLKGVRIAGLAAKVEVRGVVVTPRGTTGVRPLVMFLHGRHSTCYDGSVDGDATGDWPCPAGWKPIPSYRGYLQTQQLLASQGYDTVSISANGINGQDWVLADGGAAARSELVRKHLRLWTTWSASAAAHRAAPAVVAAAPRADLGDVVLVGHSRGGEGVNRAALDSTTGTAVPWTIRGLVHIGPTAFGQNPAPGVPVVVLLPYCDGDVFDLQGQAYLDAARGSGADHAFRSAVLVVGANHNYFNSEWTPGVAEAPSWDDWGDDNDRVCGTRSATRLSAAQQRSVGATYTAAATALFAAGRTSVLPLLDGRGAQAASAGGARVLAHAIGGRRTPLVVPTASTGLATTGGAAARLCRTAELETPSRICDPDAEYGSTPHFLSVFGMSGEPSRRAVQVSWATKGGSAVISTGSARDLRSARSVDLRVAVPAGQAATRFTVRLVDTAGHRLVLPDTTLTGLPRTRSGFAGKTWAQDVRLSLTGARSSGIDLKRVVSLEVLPRSSAGQMWLLDAWGWRDGLSSGPAYRLPRVDVASLTVDEGSRDHVVRVPVTLRGVVTRPAKLWVLVTDPTSYEQRSFTVAVPVGARTLSVAVPVAGDRRDDYDQTTYQVAIEPVHGLVVGDYVGGVTVLDDDPAPTLTVSPAVAHAREGTDLVWELALSAPTDTFIGLVLSPVVPGAALPPELDSADVPAGWFTDQGYEVPKPPIPLSQTGIWQFLFFEPGQATATLVLPTKADARMEGDEAVVLAVPADAGPPEGLGLAPDFRLVGVVHDR